MVRMAVTFNTGKHAHAIREGGVPAPAADAIVDAIAEATDSLVTEEFLRNELAIQMAQIDARIERLRAEMWRAMYMQIGAVTAIVTAIAGIALVVARWIV